MSFSKRERPGANHVLSILVLVAILYCLSDSILELDAEQAASRVLDLSPRRKSNTGVVRYIEIRNNGLGAQFLAILDSMSLAQSLGYRFEIRTGRDWNYKCEDGNGWSCYFSTSEFDSPSTTGKQSLADNCTELFYWRTYETVPKCVLISTSLSMKHSEKVMKQTSRGSDAVTRNLARKIWEINNRTKSDISEISKHSSLSKMSHEYIGVHIRRGDKRKEGVLTPIEDFVFEVNCINPAKTLDVFVASDDDESIEKFRELVYPRKVFSIQDSNLSRTGFSEKKLLNIGPQCKRKYVTILLAEITALQRSTFFVCNLSSNLARIVYATRHQPANSTISLGVEWTPGVTWTAPVIASINDLKHFAKRISPGNATSKKCVSRL